jgi:hypothetical protein
MHLGGSAHWGRAVQTGVALGDLGERFGPAARLQYWGWDLELWRTWGGATGLETHGFGCECS